MEGFTTIINGLELLTIAAKLSDLMFMVVLTFSGFLNESEIKIYKKCFKIRLQSLTVLEFFHDLCIPATDDVYIWKLETIFT